jgi:hypothetical protein
LKCQGDLSKSENTKAFADILQACKPTSSCVSTAAFKSPSQYLPPWTFVPDTRQGAFRSLLSVLKEMEISGTAQIVGVYESTGYIKSRLKFELGGVSFADDDHKLGRRAMLLL